MSAPPGRLQNVYLGARPLLLALASPAAAQTKSASQAISSIVSGFGFPGTKCGHETPTNVALACGFLKNGDRLADFPSN